MRTPVFSCLRQPRGFYRRVASLALPVVLQNLITTSLGFIDTFMVGLLGSEEMSALTVANVPMFILQLVVFGLQSGSSVLISQYWGKGDRKSINRVLGIGIFVAGGISALAALVMCTAPQWVLYLITDNPRLVVLAMPYLRIVGVSYVFNALASIYIGMQRSTENPRFGMLVFASSTVFNTLGNYILIFGKLGFPALGIRGAAIATLLARVLEFAVSAVYALRSTRVPLQWRCIARPGMDIFRNFIKYSTPVLLNESLWGFGTSMFTVIMGHMAISTEIISAQTIAGGIDRMITAGIFGVAAASSVIVGKEIGMGNRESTLAIGKALALVALGAGIAVGLAEQLLFWLILRPFILPLFRLTPAAASICTTMVCCYSAAAPLNSLMTTVIVGILRGGGDVHVSLLIDVVPLWVQVIPMLALFGLVLDVPVVWFCLVMTFESLVKTPFGLWRLLSGRWIHDVTVTEKAS